MTEFYKRYIQFCAKKDVSPSGAAKAIGLSNAAANGWKNNKMPTDTTLAKLAEYFECSVEDLTGEQKIPTSKQRPGKRKSFCSCSGSCRTI